MDIARIDTLYRTILIKLDLYIVVQLRTHIVTTPIYVYHAFIGIVRWITISNYTFLKIKKICMSKRETLKIKDWKCPPPCGNFPHFFFEGFPLGCSQKQVEKLISRKIKRWKLVISGFLLFALFYTAFLTFIWLLFW